MSADHDMADLPARWMRHAREPAVVARLESIQRRLAGEIASRGPTCWASGRCCNFERAGHRLFATGLETAYTIARLDYPLTQDALRAAVDRGGCPFQVGGLCGVHTLRPVGCRVYFCDPTAQGWMEDLAERAHRSMRELHESEGIEYRYGEWRSMLALFAGSPDRSA